MERYALLEAHASFSNGTFARRTHAALPLSWRDPMKAVQQKGAAFS
tara:strand:- start:7 stop:144 length:138 start_codon:yes stop_codon:yes gene_type:complete